MADASSFTTSSSSSAKRRIRFYDYCALIPSYDEEIQHLAGSTSGSASSSGAKGPSVSYSPQGRPRLCTRAYSLPVPTAFTAYFARNPIPADFQDDPSFFPSSQPRFNLRLPSITRRKRSSSVSGAGTGQLRSCLKGRNSGDGQDSWASSRSRVNQQRDIYCPALKSMAQLRGAQADTADERHDQVTADSSTAVRTESSAGIPSSNRTVVPDSELPDDIVPLNACCKRCIRGAQYAEKTDYVERFSRTAREKLERDNVAKYERGELKEYPGTAAVGLSAASDKSAKNCFLTKLCSEEEEEVPLPPCAAAAANGEKGCPDVDELDRLRKKRATSTSPASISETSLDSCPEESESDLDIEADDVEAMQRTRTGGPEGRGATLPIDIATARTTKQREGPPKLKTKISSASSSSSSSSSLDADELSSVFTSPAPVSERMLSPLTSVSSLSDSEGEQEAGIQGKRGERERESLAATSDPEDNDHTPIATPKTRSLSNFNGSSQTTPNADPVPAPTGGSRPVRGNSLGLVGGGGPVRPTHSSGGGAAQAAQYSGGAPCARSSSSIVPGGKLHEEIINALQDANLTKQSAYATSTPSSSAPSSSSAFAAEFFKGKSRPTKTAESPQANAAASKSEGGGRTGGGWQKLLSASKSLASMPAVR